MREDDATLERFETERARTRRDSMMGREIAARYDVTGLIGTGGMGTVYLAHQRGLSRNVAVKVLRKELSGDSDTVVRFHREANAMSLLTHPNSVRVFDFGGTDDGRLYIVMELLQGRLLTGYGPLTGIDGVIRAARIARQMLGALAEAHTKGIVHRDLKPDNIFLADIEGQNEPVVKVLDFGIAKIVLGDARLDAVATATGTVFGTPRYMSPEQAEGRELDGRSDLYAVGVLLYEMLAGRAPFEATDSVALMTKHVKDRVPSFRETAPDRVIPAELEEVVLRALEKNPKYRFQSAEQFIDAIDASVPEANLYSRRHPRVSSKAPPALLAEGKGGAAWRVGAAVLVLVSLAVAAYFAVSFTSGPGHVPATRAVSRTGAATDAKEPVSKPAEVAEAPAVEATPNAVHPAEAQPAAAIAPAVALEAVHVDVPPAPSPAPEAEVAREEKPVAAPRERTPVPAPVVHSAPPKRSPEAEAKRDARARESETVAPKASKAPKAATSYDRW